MDSSRDTVGLLSDIPARFTAHETRSVCRPSAWISRAVDGGRVRREGTRGRSPATNLPVERNSTVIPNNYLQLGREARRILAYGRETRPCAGSRRPTAVGRYLTCERETHPNPPFRLQGGPSSLDAARSRTDTYTRPSARNHPPRSPSFRRMTFRLSFRARTPTPLAPDTGLRRDTLPPNSSTTITLPPEPAVATLRLSFGDRHANLQGERAGSVL